jgi:hypothetical protein
MSPIRGGGGGEGGGWRGGGGNGEEGDGGAEVVRAASGDGLASAVPVVTKGRLGSRCVGRGFIASSLEEVGWRGISGG